MIINTLVSRQLLDLCRTLYSNITVQVWFPEQYLVGYNSRKRKAHPAITTLPRNSTGEAVPPSNPPQLLRTPLHHVLLDPDEPRGAAGYLLSPIQL